MKEKLEREVARDRESKARDRLRKRLREIVGLEEERLRESVKETHREYSGSLEIGRAHV